MATRNYPGAKTTSGMIQFLINRIPAHNVYVEPFAGSAQLYFAKKPARTYQHISDINPDVVATLKDKEKERTGQSALYVTCRPALSLFVEDKEAVMQFRQAHPKWSLPYELRTIHYDNRFHYFIYLDPPYPMASRQSSRRLYRYEMTDDDHRALLQAIAKIKAPNVSIMISTRQNALYDEHLASWRKETFDTMSQRGRPVQEIIYMNYPPPALLHQYDHLGEGYIDRQRIKRKVGRFRDKITELPPYERHALIQELIAADGAAVKHFLSVSAAR